MHHFNNFGRGEVLDQSQVNKNQSEGQQDHHIIVGDGHKTTQNHQEFSGREWLATGLTLGVTEVLIMLPRPLYILLLVV